MKKVAPQIKGRRCAPSQNRAGVQLTLHPEGKPEHLDFIAWKDDRLSFYAKPRNGKPRVVAVVPSLPDGAQWIEPPFPLEYAPTKIEPCILHLPPCYESLEDQGCTVPQPWEVAYWKSHGLKFMYLTEDDDAPLEKLLEEYKAAARIDYADEIKMLGSSSLGLLEKERQKEILDRQYNTPLHISAERECSGILNMTLSMVKRGCEGLRDSYLVQCWVKEKGIDLEAMCRHRGEFLRYLQKRTGVAALVTDLRIREKYRAVVPSDFSGVDDPRFKTLCASVKYRAEFDNGEAAYLFDCSMRKELRPEEWRELKRDCGIETPHEREISKIRTAAAGKNKKVADEEEKKLVAYYWGLRRPDDPKKKPETKNNAGILTNKWLRRSKESGGLGLPDVNYSSRQIQRMAGDAK